MLTLRPAFAESDRLKLIDQISSAAVTRPRSIDLKIPSDLETIVLKAMARDTTERYVSARALAEDLERFLADRTILARRSSVRKRTWRWCRRNRALAALTSLAASLTFAVAIVSTVAALVSIHQLKRTTAAERRARLALGKSLISEGAALQRTGSIGQRFDSLDRLAEAANVLSGDREGRDRLPEIRNHAIAALGLADMRVVAERDHGDVFSFSVDAALARYAVAYRSGVVVVYRLDNHRELARLPAPEEHRFWHVATRFSPDGELLVADYAGSGGRGDLLQVWHLRRRELLASVKNRDGGAFYGGAFTPDSRRLLFCPPAGGVDYWDRNERQVVRHLALEFTPQYLAIDPEGRWLAVNSKDAPARVVVFELESGLVFRSWTEQVGGVAISWSQDGRLLAVGSWDGRVFVWDVAGSRLAGVLRGHTSAIVSAQFAHAGHLLVTASWDGTSRLWDAASGELLATASGSAHGFAPDDRRLAYEDGGLLGVWEVASGDECQTLQPGLLGNRDERPDATKVGSSAAFSPDGRLLATCDVDGVRLWEVDTGGEVAQLNDHGCADVLFHPDGTSLITAGKWGLFRWPIRPDRERGPDAVRVGPPELLRETGSPEWNRAAWLPDHRTLALVDNARARVLLVDSTNPHAAWSQPLALDSGENRRMASVAVSPDGRWLAVGGWKEAGIRVWDLHKRRFERLLRPNDPVRDMTFLAGFSPDGGWLSACIASNLSHDYYFWRTATWDREHRIKQERHAGGFFPPVYTIDGRLMAVGIAPDQVLLADPTTGREVARLTTSKPVHPTPLAFSPDGTKLVAATDQKSCLIWNLRRMRDQLAPIALDWDAPPYPASSATASTAEFIAQSRNVRVVGEILEPQARRKREREEMDRRLAANPDDTVALIHRGWLSLTERRPSEAIADLEHLHHQNPDYADVERLLGRAYEDAGDPARALEFYAHALDRAPEDHYTRFDRGMIHLALGRSKQAADDFAWVLAADPTIDKVRYQRARALIRLGRYRDALSDIDLLFTTHASDPSLFHLSGTAYDALGEREPARLAWEKVHARLPKDPDVLDKTAWDFATGPLRLRDPERAW